MSLSIQQAVEGFLLPLVQDAVAAAEKVVPKALPPAAGVLLDGALALPWVQAEITKLEVAGVHEAAILAGEGMDALTGFVLAHAKGKIHDWLQQELTAAKNFQLNLTVDEDALMAHLVEQGKFGEALKLGAKALGLS